MNCSDINCAGFSADKKATISMHISLNCLEKSKISDFADLKLWWFRQSCFSVWKATSFKSYKIHFHLINFVNFLKADLGSHAKSVPNAKKGRQSMSKEGQLFLSEIDKFLPWNPCDWKTLNSWAQWVLCYFCVNLINSKESCVTFSSKFNTGKSRIAQSDLQF